MAPQLLEVSLDDILSREALFTVLQPIVDLRNYRALGHEALTRGEPGHMLQRPDLMFQAAQQFGKVPELESLCLRSAAFHFAQSQLTGLLFLNFSPQSLDSYASEVGELTERLQAVGVRPEHVVLEVSERFPVTHMGRYQGVVNTKDLLKRITDNQIQKARYANPLTLLPGNVPIDEEIERRLRLKKQFHLCYVDLNFFKPYNDHYGYRQGDSVLRWLGQLLQRHCSKACFIGHIGGDDFIFITENPDFRQLCQTLIEQFDRGIRDYHNETDWQAGHISGSDRNGQARRFPLPGLSVGGCHPV